MSSHVLCLISIAHPPLPLFFCPIVLGIVIALVLSLYTMPKVNPRKEVGMIVRTVLKKVLGHHTAKNYYGNVNYAKKSFKAPS
jgi:hypothetical protein